MPRDRHLDWDGVYNARDLGGLPAGDGATTRWGALVRSDAPDTLTPAGWAALREHGIRTIVDLRNDDERAAAATPDGLDVVHVPLDANEDREFWRVWESGPQFGTPAYYGPHLERHPDRSARVIAAIANAQPGGVLFHCGGGRDRAGQIAMLVLALARVPPDVIAADYALSAERLARRYAALGEQDQNPEIDAFLEREGTTGERLIVDTLAAIDVEQRMRSAGLSDAELDRLRERLVGPT